MPKVYISDADFALLELYGVQVMEEQLPQDTSTIPQIGVGVTPDKVQNFINSTCEELANGNIDPLKLQVFIKAISDIQSGIKKALTDMAVDEFEKYGEHKVKMNGYYIEKAKKTSYDYSNTSAWQEYQKTIDECKAEQKSIEDLCKPLTKVKHITDDETGEMIELKPPIKRVTEYLKMTKI